MDADAKLEARAKALAHIQAATVVFADAELSGRAAVLDQSVVDDWWPAISRYHLFCVHHPPDKPWLADLWLWLSVRCWKMSAVVRQDLPDPRKGLPKASNELVMDQVGEIQKGQWSPAQAATIRKALAGEMPASLWSMAQSWRARLVQSQSKADEEAKGMLLVSESPTGQVVKTVDSVKSAKRKKIKVRVRRPKPRKKK